MGRVFKIGLGEDGSYAVTGVTQTSDPALKTSSLRAAFDAGGFAENAEAITGRASGVERKQSVAPKSYGDFTA